MRKLYLHIGHPKTGSSFLQACFANSTRALKDARIAYPRVSSAAAKKWRVSSGNAQALLQADPADVTIRRRRVLFSSEGLFLKFHDDDGTAARIRDFCAHHDIGAIEILLFLRDPIPHAESSYQQGIKRNGQTHGIEQAFARFRKPHQVLRVRRHLRRQFPGIRLNWHIHNYDRHKGDLAAVAERFLGIPTGTLDQGGKRAVNRSMNAAELALIRAVNHVSPATGADLADALCDQAPRIRPEKQYPSHAVQQAMLDRLAPVLEKINRYLDPAERYGTDLQPPAPAGDCHRFTRRQLAVITRTLGLTADAAAKLAGSVTQGDLETFAGTLQVTGRARRRRRTDPVPAGSRAG